jgi:molecular chaperone Hsp33
MEDYIVRATAAEGAVRVLAAVTTRMVSEASKVHGLAPVAAAALGRTMTAAALMSTSLKSTKDTLTIQIKGEGPLGGIVVVSDVNANVRGYVYNPEVDLPLNHYGKLDVAGAIGPNGYLNVIKDMGLKEPYIGYVELVSGEIAEDLTYYFANSEQIPSVVALGVLINPDGSVASAGGYIIQLLPDAGEDIIEYLEERLCTVPSISAMLADGKAPEDVMEILLGEKGLKIAGTSPCRYQCNCSRDRMERNMLSLGRNEIQAIIDEQKEAELQCHFCNTRYQFTEEELVQLIDPEDEE